MEIMLSDSWYFSLRLTKFKTIICEFEILQWIKNVRHNLTK